MRSKKISSVLCIALGILIFTQADLPASGRFFPAGGPSMFLTIGDIGVLYPSWRYDVLRTCVTLGPVGLGTSLYTIHPRRPFEGEIDYRVNGYTPVTGHVIIYAQFVKTRGRPRWHPAGRVRIRNVVYFTAEYSDWGTTRAWDGKATYLDLSLSGFLNVPLLPIELRAGWRATKIGKGRDDLGFFHGEHAWDRVYAGLVINIFGHWFPL